MPDEIASPDGRPPTRGGSSPARDPGSHAAGGTSRGLGWGSIARNTALVAVALFMVWLAFNVRLPELPQLQADIEALGWWGRLAFVGLYALVALTPIPVTIMAVTGGVLFGVLEGSILSLIGVLIGCWGAYWLARGLGRRTVTRMLGEHAERIRRNLGDGGFQATFMLRVLPGLPYWPVNYGAGAFGVKHRTFLVASVVASIPGQVSLVAIGAFIADPDLLGGVVVALAWVTVIVLTVWSYRAWRGTSSRPLPGTRTGVTASGGDQA